MLRTPFVGRRTELSKLSSLVEAARRGQGSLLLLGGEPGVGKTRLAEELAAEADRSGMVILRGRSYETDGASAYVPFVEILDAMVEALPAPGLREALGDEAAEVARLVPRLRAVFRDIGEPLRLPPEQEHRYVVHSVRAFVERAARARPLLLLLDDLHWADRPTLRLVDHLSGRVQQMGVLVIATYRDDEVRFDAPFAETLERLIRHHAVQRVSVRRLPIDEVHPMLAALAGQAPPMPLTELVYAETEGNPFFVEEVFRYLEQEGRLRDVDGRLRADVKIADVDVPESVRLVVGRRIRRLSEGARRMLTLAAVVGREVSLDLLESLQERTGDQEALAEAVDEACDTRLLVATRAGSGERLTFGHELVRQTLLAELSPARRRRLHGVVAEAMERVYATDVHEHAGELAHHLLAAGPRGDASKAAGYLRLAGERALEMAAYPEALRLFDHALSLATPDRDGHRAALLAHLGFARRAMGRLEEATQAWREAIDIYAELREADRVARLCVGASLSLLWIARHDTAREMARRGLLSLGDRETPERAELLAVDGLIASQLGAIDEGTEKLARALDLAERLGDDRAIGVVLASRSASLQAIRDVRGSVETGLRALEFLRSAGAVWELANLTAWLALGLHLLGRFEDAERLNEEAERVAGRVGHLAAMVLVRRERAWRAFCRQPDLEALESSARGDLELSRRAGLPSVSDSDVWLGVVDLWRGRWDQAVDRFEEAARLEAASPRRRVANAYLLLVHAYRGDAARVRTMFEEMRRHLPRVGRPSGGGARTFVLCAAEALWMVGEREASAALYPLIVELLEGGQVVRSFHSRLVHTVAGISAAAGRRWQEAEEHVRTALEQAQMLPNVPERPEIRRFQAQMLLDRDAPGDRERARDLLEQAIREYDAMGMVGHREMARSLLLRLAALPPAIPVPTPGPTYVFRREGEYWAIAFGGEVFRVKDSKGLRYLVALLRNPGREIAALDVARDADGSAQPVRRVSGREAAEAGLSASELTDLGAVLDDEAKAAYRSRLAELRDELQEAESWSDPERAARARQEIDFVAAELARAIGLRGRNRRAGSAAERARVNVTRALKASIDRLAQHDASLGRHLERTVRTGTSCAYLPDRDAPVPWTF